MNFVIASDHAGYLLKQEITKYFENKINFTDLGTDKPDISVAYPTYATKLADFIKNNPSYNGILICGTGIGMSIAVNRHKHIRAAICYSRSSAKLAKEHNNANVIIFGAREFTAQACIEMIEEFISSNFQGGRHQERLDLF